MFDYEFDATQEAEMRMAWECQDRAVRCKWCSITAISPQKNLEAAGWCLTSKGEVCPDCSLDLAFQATIRDSILC